MRSARRTTRSASATRSSTSARVVGGLLFRHREPDPDRLHGRQWQQLDRRLQRRRRAHGFELSRLGRDAHAAHRRQLHLSRSRRRLRLSGTGTTHRNSPAARDAVATSELEGTPRHKAFVYLAWKVNEQLTLTPSLELAADRTALVTSCASTLVTTGGGTGSSNATNGNCGKTSGYTGKPNYVDIGALALVNFQAEYVFNDNTTMTVGAINLLDENYSLAEGFPEPGRQFFANLRARF